MVAGVEIHDRWRGERERRRRRRWSVLPQSVPQPLQICFFSEIVVWVCVCVCVRRKFCTANIGNKLFYCQIPQILLFSNALKILETKEKYFRMKQKQPQVFFLVKSTTQIIIITTINQLIKYKRKMQKDLRGWGNHRIYCSLRVQFSFIKININIYFENIIVGFNIFYTLNIHIKFFTNQMLFIV